MVQYQQYEPIWNMYWSVLRDWLQTIYRIAVWKKTLNVHLQLYQKKDLVIDALLWISEIIS